MSRAERVRCVVVSRTVFRPCHVDGAQTTLIDPSFCPWFRTSYHRLVEPSGRAAAGTAAA
jgi:hypothetical protein